MTIQFSDQLLRHLQETHKTCLTVKLVKKRNNCCAIGVPKVTTQVPKAIEKYHVIETQEGITVYVDQSATLTNDTLTFDYTKLFLMEMIEVHGVYVERLGI